MSDKPLILAVDDDPINLEILEEALEKNYQFESVESGEQCLEKLQRYTPDIAELTGILL